MNNLLCFVIVLYLASIGQSSCCTKYLQDKCVQCPSGMHLFRDNCIYDIISCEAYKDGFECEKCKQGFTLNSNKCISTNQSSSTSIKTNTSNPVTTQQYKIVEINFKNISLITDMDLVDQLTISDEIFRSNNFKELNKAEILKAEQRTYSNSTVHIAIDYKNTKKEIYNGTVMVNLKTFIFKIISFSLYDETIKNQTAQNNQQKNPQQFIANQTIKNTQPPANQPKYTITFTAFNQTFGFPQQVYSANEVDLMNSTQLELMALLDQQGTAYLSQETNNQPSKKITKNQKLSNSSNSVQITEMGNAEIRKYEAKQKKEYLTIEYHTNDSEVDYIVVGQVISMNNKTSDELPIKLIYAGFDQQKIAKKSSTPNNNNNGTSSSSSLPKNAEQQPVTQQKTPNVTTTPANSTQSSSSSSKPSQTQQPLTSSQAQALISKMQFILVQDDLELLNDIYYMISKDQVVHKLKQYEDVIPDKVYIASLSKSSKSSPNQQIEQLKTTNYYKIIFIQNKNLTAQVIVRCNLTTFVPRVQKVKYITNQTTKPLNPTNNATSNSTTNTTIKQQTQKNATNTINATNITTTPLPVSSPTNSSNNTTNQIKDSNTNLSSNNQTNNPTQSSSNNSSNPSKITNTSTTSSSNTSSIQNLSNTSSNNTNSQNNTFQIPSGFNLCNQSISSNIYYLIAMDTLTNKDKKYIDHKPIEIYLKNQTNTVKIQFILKFQILFKNTSKQIWVVSMDVFQSSFKAQITKNQLIQTINQPTSLKQQSDQNQSLKKDDLLTKTPITPPKITGKVVLLRDDKQRILMEQNYSLTYSHKNNHLRSSV